MRDYVLTATLLGGGGYEGHTSVTFNYPLAHTHSVYLEYQRVTGADYVIGILDVEKDGVSLFGRGGEQGGLWVGDDQTRLKLLDTNSQSEQRTYTFIWSPQGEAHVRLSFYVTEWPNQLSIFGEYDAYIGPFGILMIAAGAILLALTGKR